MGCREVLERYSDYRDGRTDTQTRHRLSQHLRRCARCSRYHKFLSRGVWALRAASNLEPSAGFRRELAARLERAPAVDEPVTPAPAGVMAGLMLAVAVALLIWDGAGSGDQPAVTAQLERAQERPLPVVVANPGMPFVSFADLTGPAFSTEWRTPSDQGVEEFPAMLLAGDR